MDKWVKQGNVYINSALPGCKIEKVGRKYKATRIFHCSRQSCSCSVLTEAKAYCKGRFLVYGVRPVSDARYITSFATAEEADNFCKTRNGNGDITYFY